MGCEKYWLSITKVVVTFYLRLRNEFHSFPTKNQASNWMTCWVSQSERPGFWREMAGIHHGYSFLNLRYKVTTTLVYIGNIYLTRTGVCVFI